VDCFVVALNTRNVSPTKCHSSQDSALHKIAWYDPESSATKKEKKKEICHLLPDQFKG
jgi:hypothetical protein